MSITVYTKPECQSCKASKRHLDRLGVKYTAIDVTESEDAYETVSLLGYASVPVVVVDPKTHWSGYVPDRIDALMKVC